jgi:hypothetical protein
MRYYKKLAFALGAAGIAGVAMAGSTTSQAEPPAKGSAGEMQVTAPFKSLPARKIQGIHEIDRLSTVTFAGGRKATFNFGYANDPDLVVHGVDIKYEHCSASVLDGFHNKSIAPTPYTIVLAGGDCPSFLTIRADAAAVLRSAIVSDFGTEGILPMKRIWGSRIDFAEKIMNYDAGITPQPAKSIGKRPKLQLKK